MHAELTGENSREHRDIRRQVVFCGCPPEAGFYDLGRFGQDGGRVDLARASRRGTRFFIASGGNRKKPSGGEAAVYGPVIPPGCLPA